MEKLELVGDVILYGFDAVVGSLHETGEEKLLTEGELVLVRSWKRVRSWEIFIH